MSSLPQSDGRRSAVERLAQHGVSGGMTLDEYAARVVALEEATTSEQLDAALDGLPRTLDTPPRRRSWLVSVFGGAEQRGRWRLSSRLQVISVFGGINVDLGRAQLEARESVITVIAVFGGAGIIAPSGISTQLSGLSLFGGKGDKRRTGSPFPGSPLIRVRAFVLFGGVTIKNRRTWTLRSLLHRVTGRSPEPTRA